MTAKGDVTEFFTHDHRACDALWAAVESAADGGDAAGTLTQWQAFEEATRRHLAMEEEVLFPAFERATGMTAGPTQVMRMEHERMRGLLDQMSAAARAGAFDDVLDHGDTLLMLTQQHNQKEEMMLYPLAAQNLANQWAGLLEQLERYATD
jgi:hemerythrin-like domain-containing protein